MLFRSREAQEKATPVTAMGEALKAAQERQKITLEPVTALEAEAAPAAPVVEEAEAVKAPLVSTEHVAQTDEGRILKGFFDAITPSSESSQEQNKFQSVKNSAAETLLEYDIVKPGETTSPGIRAALNYLAKRVGGADKLQRLMEQIGRAHV